MAVLMLEGLVLKNDATVLDILDSAFTQMNGEVILLTTVIRLVAEHNSQNCKSNFELFMKQLSKKCAWQSCLISHKHMCVHRKLL